MLSNIFALLPHTFPTRACTVYMSPYLSSPGNVRPERQISPPRLTPNTNRQCLASPATQKPAAISSSAAPLNPIHPQNVRRWNVKGRHAATSTITLPPIITARRAIRRLQLPRVCEATDERCIPGEYDRAGPPQGPGTGSEGSQGPPGPEAANGHQPVLRV